VGIIYFLPFMLAGQVSHHFNLEAATQIKLAFPILKELCLEGSDVGWKILCGPLISKSYG